MFVSPSARRLGVGSLLIKAAKSHARKNGIAQIRLRTHESNMAGISCYVKNGFEAEGEPNIFAEFLDENLVFRDATLC